VDYFYNFEKLAYLKGKRPSGCILCLINEGSSEVDDLTVHHDDYFTAALNLYPYNPGHLLVFPNRHVEDIRRLTGVEITAQHELVTTLLDVLDSTHSPAAYNIGYNMGLDAGASIRHLHAHIIPRYAHEIGIADLIAGKRVLVEDPRETRDRLREAIRVYLADHPRSIRTT
jgi:ATP adenylyltransferase